MALTKNQIAALDYLAKLPDRGKWGTTAMGAAEDGLGWSWQGVMQTMSSLSRRGLVAKSRVPRTGMVYSITEAGRTSLKAHKKKKT